jgi:hypothetical protein
VSEANGEVGHIVLVLEQRLAAENYLACPKNGAGKTFEVEPEVLTTKSS